MARPQLQVLGAVIGPDEVAVMDGFALSQRSAQDLGHDQDMLGDPAFPRLGIGMALGSLDPHIAFGVDPAPPALAERRQRLAFALLCPMATAQSIRKVSVVTVGKLTTRTVPLDGLQRLASGELVKMAGAKPVGLCLAVAVREATWLIGGAHGSIVSSNMCSSRVLGGARGTQGPVEAEAGSIPVGCINVA